MSDDGEEVTLAQKKSEQDPRPRRRAKKVKFPRRAPSVVIPDRQIVYITADKTTCAECPCFPKEDPYMNHKKLNQCQKSPLTLYELAAEVVDNMPFPEAFEWTVSDVADWMDRDVGFPQYRAFIIDNHIDGMRLLMLEEPSKLPEINIHYLNHILTITQQVRHLYGVDFVRFARSVGLPPRYPLTHCTWFKSRTGPSWGIRKNWTRSNILRWMKIIMPEPVYMNHWDLVWYIKPDFPKVMFGRLSRSGTLHKFDASDAVPHYVPITEKCIEYTAARKFRLHPEISIEKQMIWMEHQKGWQPEPTPSLAELKKKKLRLTAPKMTRLMPKKIDLAGLRGKELILARRVMPKSKFF